MIALRACAADGAGDHRLTGGQSAGYLGERGGGHAGLHLSVAGWPFIRTRTNDVDDAARDGARRHDQDVLALRDDHLEAAGHALPGVGRDRLQFQGDRVLHGRGRAAGA